MPRLKSKDPEENGHQQRPSSKPISPQRKLEEGKEDRLWKCRMFVLFFPADCIKYSAKGGDQFTLLFLFLMYRLTGAVNIHRQTWTYSCNAPITEGRNTFVPAETTF